MTARAQRGERHGHMHAGGIADKGDVGPFGKPGLERRHRAAIVTRDRIGVFRLHVIMDELIELARAPGNDLGTPSPFSARRFLADGALPDAAQTDKKHFHAALVIAERSARLKRRSAPIDDEVCARHISRSVGHQKYDRPYIIFRIRHPAQRHFGRIGFSTKRGSCALRIPPSVNGVDAQP